MLDDFNEDREKNCIFDIKQEKNAAILCKHKAMLKIAFQKKRKPENKYWRTRNNHF